MSSFALPVFNISCNIWHGGLTHMPPSGVPDLVVNGNLANGRVWHLPVWQRRLPGLGAMSMSSSILFPKGTDVRDVSTTTGPDIIECPAGTGRLYWVTYVDDIARGFGNEHRWVVMQKVWTYDAFSIYRWPTPIP